MILQYIELIIIILFSIIFVYSIEKRLANIDAVLAAASKVILDNHSWPMEDSDIRIRTDGSIIASYSNDNKN